MYSGSRGREKDRGRYRKNVFFNPRADRGPGYMK
jgi:hypothetical protein